jgi:hypothetical protein
LDEFLENASVKFPSLTNLSLLKNPLMPYFIGDAQYYNYRLKVCKKLPKLQILDGFDVAMNENFRVEEFIEDKKEEEVPEI